jgi:putative hydrolase of the HAD superfamily
MWDEAFPERMTGELSNYQECIGHICRRMGAPASDEKIELTAEIRFRMNIHEVTTPRDEALEVLSALKESGLKTGLLSDCSTETSRVWGDSPLASLIDAPVFSCVEGMRKPEPRFYMTAVDRLAVSPGNCVYVGDGIGQELHGAAGLGMHAVQILVPGEDNYDRYRGEWNGPVISSLREILEIVK